MINDKQPHYIGHRRRLKEKFLNLDSSHFSNYEILELLLFYAIPRKDVKPLAKALVTRFGNISNIMNASREQIMEIEGSSETVFLLLKINREITKRFFESKILNQHIISSWADLLNYLKLTMSHLKIEQFRVLFLNKKNILITDEVMATGTIDHTAVYPREIIKRVLFHNASAIIMVHNHPSGNPKPSKSDIELTTQIVEACKVLNIDVHDHVIIGNNSHYSFKSNMLL